MAEKTEFRFNALWNADEAVLEFRTFWVGISDLSARLAYAVSELLARISALLGLGSVTMLAPDVVVDARVHTAGALQSCGQGGLTVTEAIARPSCKVPCK